MRFLSTLLLAAALAPLPGRAQPAPATFTLDWARAAPCVLFVDPALSKLAGELRMRHEDGRWRAGPHALLKSAEAVDFDTTERVFEVPDDAGPEPRAFLIFRVVAPDGLELQRYTRLRTPERLMCARATVTATRRSSPPTPPQN